MYKESISASEVDTNATLGAHLRIGASPVLAVTVIHPRDLTADLHDDCWCLARLYSLGADAASLDAVDDAWLIDCVRGSGSSRFPSKISRAAERSLPRTTTKLFLGILLFMHPNDHYVLCHVIFGPYCSLAFGRTSIQPSHSWSASECLVRSDNSYIQGRRSKWSPSMCTRGNGLPPYHINLLVADASVLRRLDYWTILHKQNWF